MTINVYDDIVPQELAKTIWATLRSKNAPWQWYQRSDADVPDAKFWKLDLGNKFLNDSSIKKLFDIVNSTLFYDMLEIEYKLGKPNVYGNGQTMGQDGSAHIDGGDNDLKTILYYPIPFHQQPDDAHWKKHWGGETIFYDEDGEIIKSILPKPNRIVIFPGDILHRSASPTRFYGGNLRVTIAYKSILKTQEKK